MAIETADEFVRLRVSEDPAEYSRASSEPASIKVWLDVIARYPNMRGWVAHNNAVPLEILSLLARDLDPNVRSTVANKRKLSTELFELLAMDPDEGVRARIACNAKVPSHVLEKLKRDASTAFI